MDTADQRWVTIAQCDEPFEAETYAEALHEERLDVWVKERQGGVVDPLTSPSRPFFEVCVLESQAERAAQLLLTLRAELAADEADAARAAEEEERLTETSPPASEAPESRRG